MVLCCPRFKSPAPLVSFPCSLDNVHVAPSTVHPGMVLNVGVLPCPFPHVGGPGRPVGEGPTRLCLCPSASSQ